MSTATIPAPEGGWAAAAKAGQFTAVFARGEDAKAFYDRITGAAPGFDGRVAGPDQWYVTDVELNRKGGRVVTFTRDREVPDEGSQPGWYAYWVSMAETVGAYGSTFGEPPFGRGRRTATLNGMPGPAEM